MSKRLVLALIFRICAAAGYGALTLVSAIHSVKFATMNTGVGDLGFYICAILFGLFATNFVLQVCHAWKKEALTRVAEGIAWIEEDTSRMDEFKKWDDKLKKFKE